VFSSFLGHWGQHREKGGEERAEHIGREGLEGEVEEEGTESLEEGGREGRVGQYTHLRKHSDMPNRSPSLSPSLPPFLTWCLAMPTASKYRKAAPKGAKRQESHRGSISLVSVLEGGGREGGRKKEE